MTVKIIENQSNKPVVDCAVVVLVVTVESAATTDTNAADKPTMTLTHKLCISSEHTRDGFVQI